MQRLALLDAETKGRAYRLIACAADQGVSLRVTSTFRSFDEQAALYAQGRESLSAVNRKRIMIGLWEIEAAQNRIVTRAKPGKSWHNWRRAFDVVPVDAASTADLSDPDLPLWDAPYWPALGEIGKAIGLEWGGYWTRPDRPHFQFAGGDTLEGLIAKWPRGPKEE